MIRPALLGLLIAMQAHAATLDVAVSGLRNVKGRVLVAVCPKAQFLRDSCQYKGSAPAQPGETVVRVTGIPPGVYAVQAFHSEDGSGVLHRSFWGVPREGIGFSRDAAFHFGPPRFADAAVRIGPEGGRVRIVLRYYQ